MLNRGSKSVHPALGGSSAGSVPPEEHLGLGTMLPARRPPSSIKDSSSGSLGKKMKAGEPSTSASSAGQNEVDVNGNLSTAEILALDDDDPETEEIAGLTGKRKKRCTSVVWQYFTKRVVEVEVDGKKYEQLQFFSAWKNFIILLNCFLAPHTPLQICSIEAFVR